MFFEITVHSTNKYLQQSRYVKASPKGGGTTMIENDVHGLIVSLGQSLSVGSVLLLTWYEVVSHTRLVDQLPPLT